MALLSVQGEVKRVWLVDANPLQLPEPSDAWQTRLYDFDKMLRVMPSQREHVYRLCRIVRREARMGLNALVLHDHPDTRAMIKFGVVPVSTLTTWAIRESAIEKVIRDLRDRDAWSLYGGDINQLVDALEAQEDAAKAEIQREQDGDLDERSANAFHAIKYGRTEQVLLGYSDHARMAAIDAWLRGAPDRPHGDPEPLSALPAFPDPDAPPVTGLHNGNQLSSALPPEGTPAPSHRIVLTDS